jgi:hypothetical protein
MLVTSQCEVATPGGDKFISMLLYDPFDTRQIFGRKEVVSARAMMGSSQNLQAPDVTPDHITCCEKTSEAL